MAALLQTLHVPRSSCFRGASPALTSSVPGLSISRKVSKLPEFKGLRIGLRSPMRLTLATTSRDSRIMRRGIVCEAHDTAALDVPSVTDSTWQQLVMEGDLPVLVEFWAPWCGPCRMIHPVIGELSKQYAGKLRCFKLNTDESPSVATQYGIRSIPTVIIFKSGEKKDAVIGAVPKSTLTASIEKFLER
eukprot:TRINITY_DN2280_c0_g3_i1.p1 TRINITY_DN2280_c0_g3~~TRINITY_DN2280_c0_g3_i1.p1  ORF type:complete len:189 (-),score=11.50 TRINITY_DN2280_c0_g3_i1:179-745(-)